MDIDVDFKGFDDFKKLLLSNIDSDLDGIHATVYNNKQYAKVLEYGSIPGKKPWPKPGHRTKYGFDPETGGIKVFSSAAHGMLRSTKKAARGRMIFNLSKIKLDKPIQPQIKKAINNAASFWVKSIKRKSLFPDFVKAWRLKRYK